MTDWVGFDPGGKKSFGVGFVNSDGSSRSLVVSSVEEAVEAVSIKPKGIGIDAPLWWSAGVGGGRKADQWLRKEFSISSGTVQSVNSLRGAAIAQAFLLIDLLRQKFGDLNVTESHPKALLIALYKDKNAGGSSFFKDFNVSYATASEHERDAVIAGICAREGFIGNWSLDLSQERFPTEQNPQSHWVGPVKYFWPLVQL